MNVELKKQLLRLLSQDARMAVSDIAERLDVTEETVSAAIKELEDANEIVGYCALIDESVKEYHNKKELKKGIMTTFGTFVFPEE